MDQKVLTHLVAVILSLAAGLWMGYHRGRQEQVNEVRRTRFRESIGAISTSGTTLDLLDSGNLEGLRRLHKELLGAAAFEASQTREFASDLQSAVPSSLQAVDRAASWAERNRSLDVERQLRAVRGELSRTAGSGPPSK